MIVGFIAVIVQLVFWYFVFSKLLILSSAHHATPSNVKRPSVSVVICNKNGANYLENLILKISQQSVQAEILIIDDFSTDDSINVLEKLKTNYPQLKVFICEKDIPGKKYALRQVLKKVDTEWALLTDVDCVPKSYQWIERMLNAASNTKSIVLGFSPHQKTAGFLNKWIRYETWLTAVQYLSWAAHGHPYMGVGRNVMYHKSIFSKIDLLESHQKYASGDDDLFINMLANRKNTSLCISPDSWTISEPKHSWKNYKKQKIRHLSVGSLYKKKDIMWLTVFSISLIIIYLAIFYLTLSGQWKLGILLWLIRIILLFPIVVLLFRKLDMRDLIPFWIPLDLLTACFYLYFSIFTIKRNKVDW